MTVSVALEEIQPRTRRTWHLTPVLFLSPRPNLARSAICPEDILPNPPLLRRAIDEGRISVRNLAAAVHFASHLAVSEFLALPWLWQQLTPAGCRGLSALDLLGAPIDVASDGSVGHGQSYNGSVSSRNRSMILDVVKRISWNTERNEGWISQAACVTQEPYLKFRRSLRLSEDEGDARGSAADSRSGFDVRCRGGLVRRSSGVSSSKKVAV